MSSDASAATPTGSRSGAACTVDQRLGRVVDDLLGERARRVVRARVTSRWGLDDEQPARLDHHRTAAVTADDADPAAQPLAQRGVPGHRQDSPLGILQRVPRAQRPGQRVRCRDTRRLVSLAHARIAEAFTPGHYSTAAAASLVPPTVGLDGIYSVGTDGVVQAMQRGTGATSGLWPPTWNPVALGKPAHNRSPVVTFSAGARLFVGTESGELHAVDARTGSIVWSRAAGFPVGSQQLMPGSTGTQATPAGLFKAFGGLNDLLLVGTATAVGNTQFFALDPTNGATLDFYPNGGDTPPGLIDNVFGMAVVDYPGNKVYFGTAGSAFTLWGLDMGPSGAPDLKRLRGAGLESQAARNHGRDDRRAGGTQRPALPRHRQRRGLGDPLAARQRRQPLQLHPRRRPGEGLRLARSARRSPLLHDARTRSTACATTERRSPRCGRRSPSRARRYRSRRPGTDNLYVGDGTGRLLQIDVVSKAITPFQLDTGTVQIGAPSLDNVNSLVLVGSDKGVIYAVRVP